MRTGIALCASLLAAVITSSVHADTIVNLLNNGELAKATKAKVNTFVTISPKTKAASTPLPGWTVTSGTVDLVANACLQAPTGMGYSVDLLGTPGVGSMRQTVAHTDADSEYEFSFEMSVNPTDGTYKESSTTKKMRVEIWGADYGTSGAVPLVSRDYSMTNGTRTATNMQWVNDEDVGGESGSKIQFQGTGGAITIVLSALASDPMPKKATAAKLSKGAMVGNLQLFTVGGGPAPEPASLGILGLGASALLLKRRRGR
jgi:hypothetical protein